MSNMLSYYVALDGQSQGPFTIGQLREMWKSGRVNLATQFWSDDGFPDWRALSEIADVLEPPRVVAPVAQAERERDPEVTAGESVLVCVTSLIFSLFTFLLGIVLYFTGRKNLGGRMMLWSVMWGVILMIVYLVVGTYVGVRR